LLTSQDLKLILDGLARLHAVKMHEPSEEFLAKVRHNYSGKIRERWDGKSFGVLEDSKFCEALGSTRAYAKTVKECRAIHGDPVLTNVLITNGPSVKFIDMRGRQQDELTVYGDPNYDYAKVLQSLIGYDHILHGEKFNPCHSQEIQEYFWDLLRLKGVSCHGAIKDICRTNVYSMLCLHEPANRPKFIEMLNHIYRT